MCACFKWTPRSVIALIALSCACIAVLVINPTNSHSEEARRLARIAQPSVVLIIVQDARMQPLREGSGFVVGDGLIATDLGLVGDAPSALVKFVGDDTLYEIAEVVGADQERQLALLSVPGAGREALTIGEGEEMTVGDRIYVVGNPSGLGARIYEGIISGTREVGGVTLLHTTAPISTKSSGGPILNSSGQVIGIGMARSVSRGGEPLNFAIPSSYLVGLVAQRTAVAAELPSLPDRRHPPLPQMRDEAPTRTAQRSQSAEHDHSLHIHISRVAHHAPDADRDATYHVQIASMQTENAALQAFAQLRDRFHHLLGHFEHPDIQIHDLGPQGVWFRVRVGPMEQRVAAQRLCEQIKSAGGDCLVMR